MSKIGLQTYNTLIFFKTCGQDVLYILLNSFGHSIFDFSSCIKLPFSYSLR